MSKMILISLLLFVGLSTVLSKPVFAHVLISDDTKTVGAVLHVVPDDDPIAGQQANLYFDIQTKKLNEKNTKLTITNLTTDEKAVIPIQVDNSSVNANYIFPVQGTYQLTLMASSDKVYTFNYSQRISRGATGSALDRPTYPLATIALIFSATLLLFLLIIMFNHRKEINTHSSF
ncbi:MAG: hypothetical protein ABIQ04_00750 [Candidatus Saccharimonadales bacterium]